MIWFWAVVGVIAFLGLSVFFGAPYVPTRKKELRDLFVHGVKLSHRDMVVDMGSGDGVVLREAIRAGAGRAVGYEIHPFFFMLGWLRTRQVRSKVSVRFGDARRVSLPGKTTVVYVFGVERDMSKIYARVQAEARRLGRAVTLVSYGNEVTGRRSRVYGAYHIYEITL